MWKALKFYKKKICKYLFQLSFSDKNPHFSLFPEERI